MAKKKKKNEKKNNSKYLFIALQQIVDDQFGMTVLGAVVNHPQASMPIGSRMNCMQYSITIAIALRMCQVIWKNSRFNWQKILRPR